MTEKRTAKVQYKVISDTHFWHRNILNYCDRPWDTLETMSNDMMGILVDQSTDDDVLYFLGDLCFQFGTYKDWLVERLTDMKGKMRWVVGNHDNVFDKFGEIREAVRSVTDLFEFVGFADYKVYHGKHVYFSHYPLHIAPADRSRLVSIHGHTHGSIDNPFGRIDVGVDSLYGLSNQHSVVTGLDGYNFAPISLRKAMELAEMELPAAYIPREGEITF